VASWTSAGLPNLSLLAGTKENACSVSSTISISAGFCGSFTGWNWASRLSARRYDFSKSERAIPARVVKGIEGVGTLITCLVIFHSNWSSESRAPSVPLQWSFRQSFSWRVTDLCRWLASAVRQGH
jgi:hypothetical protein